MASAIRDLNDQPYSPAPTARTRAPIHLSTASQGIQFTIDLSDFESDNGGEWTFVILAYGAQQPAIAASQTVVAAVAAVIAVMLLGAGSA